MRGHCTSARLFGHVLDEGRADGTGGGGTRHTWAPAEGAGRNKRHRQDVCEQDTCIPV